MKGHDKLAMDVPDVEMGMQENSYLLPMFSQTGRKSVTPSSRLVPSSNSADGFQGSYEHFATSSSSEALHGASAAVGSFRMENNGHSQSFISSGNFFSIQGQLFVLSLRTKKPVLEFFKLSKYARNCVPLTFVL